MQNNIEKLYEEIKKRLNEDEKNNCELYIYTKNGFAEYKKCYKKDTLSIRIKIKEDRKNHILQVLGELGLNYNMINDNKYYVMIEINSNKNYIILDYVVNSHIIIPNSFLGHFGYKTEEGKKINYIDVGSREIKNKKTKEYKTEYGYYSKSIEDILNKEFESKIAIINKEIHYFRNKKRSNVFFTKERIKEIYDFFDVTTYRNVKILNQVNQQSLSSILVGNYTHDQLMELVFCNNFQHVYRDLKINIIINKTERDFIINDSMISSIMCDGGNEIIIMPINKKACLALLTEEYYKKYVVNGELYFMNIENETQIEMINRYIYSYAKNNKENVIGSKKELEILFSKEGKINV